VTKPEAEALVARAIAFGVLAKESLPPEVEASLAGQIETFEGLMQNQP
jgi:hypothetical protein